MTTGTTTPLRCVLLNLEDPILQAFAKEFGARDDVSLVGMRGMLEPTKKEMLDIFPGLEIFTCKDDMHTRAHMASSPLPGSLLDEKTLDEFGDLERTYMEMTDRFCAVPLTAGRRRRMYYEDLAYCLHYFDMHSVDAVLCVESPHMCFDYVFCEVARRRGVTVGILDLTLFDDTILLHTGVEERIPPEGYLVDASMDEIRTILGEKLSAKLDEDGKIYEWTRATGDTQRVPGRFLFAMQFLWAALRTGLNPSFWTRSKAFKSYFTFNGKLMRWSGNTAFAKLLLKAKNHSLMKHYHSMALNDAPDGKYVFFALHYQPERSTCPEGGIYTDQLLAVETLAAALPENWKIAVKEHPYQFSGVAHTLHARTKVFYDHLRAIENVVLMGLDVPSQRLVAKAEVVATITGTVGWEALGAGKPVLAFGSPWYTGAPGAFRITGTDSCRKALDAMRNNSHEEIIRGRYRFIAWNKDRLVDGAIADYLMTDPDGIPFLSRRMAKAVANWLRGIQDNKRTDSSAEGLCDIQDGA